MAYNEQVAQRLRELFLDRDEIIEKKMFGGIAFILSGNMCCGVIDDVLMARVGPDQYQESLSRPYAREMDFTGRSMRGFVYVSLEGFKSDIELRSWVAICERFASSLPPK